MPLTLLFKIARTWETMVNHRAIQIDERGLAVAGSYSVFLTVGNAAIGGVLAYRYGPTPMTAQSSTQSVVTHFQTPVFSTCTQTTSLCSTVALENRGSGTDGHSGKRRDRR